MKTTACCRSNWTRLLATAGLMLAMHSHLWAASPNPIPIGKWPGYHRGNAWAVAVAGNYAYLPAGDLQVFDITDPTKPKRVGWYPLDPESRSIVVSGGYAYVTGSDTATLQSRLKIIDVHDAANPKTVGQYPASGLAMDVAVSGNYAYVTDEFGGLYVLDVSNPAQPQLLGRSYGWGAIALSGKDAFILSQSQAVQVIDISDPTHPERLVSWVSNSVTNPVNIAASGNYAYLTDNNGLEVVDISNPSKPLVTGSIGPAPGQLGGGFGIAVAGRYVCVVSGAGLTVVDVSDPTNPRLTGTSGLGNQQAFAVAVQDHYAFVAAGGLVVVDIADPTKPTVVASAYTGDSKSTALAGNYAYLADGMAGLEILDVSNPALPLLAGQFVPSAPTPTNGYPPSIEDVVIRDHYAFVGNSVAGLQIVDIADRTAPRLLGQASNIGSVAAIALAGDYAYTAGENFTVLDVKDPTNPQRLGSVQNGQGPVRLFGNYACISAILSGATTTGWGLEIIDVQDPVHPQIVSQYYPFQTLSFVNGIAVLSSYAYLAEEEGLEIMDIRDPIHPESVFFSTVAPRLRDVATAGTQAYLAGGSGLAVLDVSDPSKPVYLGKYQSQGTSLNAVTIDGDKAYASTGADGLVIFQLPAMAPRFDPGSRLQGDGLHLFLRGQNGQSIQLQRSPDLKTWQDWRTITATGVAAELIDSTAPANESQFYRALVQ